MNQKTDMTQLADAQLSYNTNNINLNKYTACFAKLEQTTYKFIDSLQQYNTILIQFQEKFSHNNKKNNKIKIQNSNDKFQTTVFVKLNNSIDRLTNRFERFQEKLISKLSTTSSDKNSEIKSHILSGILNSGSSEKNIKLIANNIKADEKDYSEIKSLIEKFAYENKVSYVEASNVFLQVSKNLTTSLKDSSLVQKIEKINELSYYSQKLSTVTNSSTDSTFKIFYETQKNNFDTTNNPSELLESLYATLKTAPQLHVSSFENIIKKSASAATQSGIPLDSYSAVVSALNNQGYVPQEIIDSINTLSIGLLHLNTIQKEKIKENPSAFAHELVRNIEKPESKQQQSQKNESLNALNIEKSKLFNENGQVDLAYLINKLESSSITKTQKEEHIKTIFGTENYEKILKIIEPKNKEKNFNNIHKEITEFKEKNTLEKDYQANIDDPNQKIKDLCNSLERLKSKLFGGKIGDFFITLVGYAEKFIDTINKMPQSLLTTIGLLSIAGLGLFKGIGLIFKSIGSFSKIKGTAKESYEYVKSTKMGNKISSKSKNIFNKFKKFGFKVEPEISLKSTEKISKFKKIGSKIKQGVPKIKKLNVSRFKKITTGTAKLASSAKSPLGKIKQIFSKITPVFSKVTGIFSKIAPIFTKLIPVFSRLFGFARVLLLVFGRIALALFPITNILTIVIPLIITHWDTIMKLMPDSLKKGIGEAIEYCVEKVTYLWNKLKNIFGFGDKKSNLATINVNDNTKPNDIKNDKNFLSFNEPKSQESLHLPHFSNTQSMQYKNQTMQNSTQTNVLVKFDNAPKGMSAIATTTGDANFDLKIGRTNMIN
ncbi:hypothetical protein [Spirobacillus cienkowskii]|uniref:hypothetical protein n=1 Tax=Spirobacillus cienkowskii TaxID=495820 RepID=UPI0030D19450